MNPNCKFTLTRRGLAASAAAAALASCANTPHPPEEQQQSQRAYMERLAAFGFSGAVCVESGGTTVLSQGYGFANRTEAVPFTADTVFNVASFSKTITATVAMKLIEHGQLSLADPVGRYVPQAPVDKAGITVGQLLSHSAGLTRESRRPRTITGRDQLLALMLATPLDRAPGAQMAYSNDGYRILAAIIEVAAARPFRDVVRELTFVPAGMNSAGFVDENSWPDHQIAIGYNEWKALGSFRELGAPLWADGPGSVVASLNDLRAFMSAYIAGRLVSASSRDAMTTAQSRNAEEAYGYGWFVGQLQDGAKLVTHGGDNTGYHTEVRWYPTRQRLIIVTTTQELYDDSGSGLGVQKRIIANNLSRLFDGNISPWPPSARAIEPRRADALSGSYLSADNAQLNLSRPFGPTAGFWIGASGQSAINCLENADAERQARYAAKNTQSMALATATSARDRVQLRALLAPDVLFMRDGLIADFESAVDRLGQFSSIELLGTRGEITGDDHMRTIIRMHFARGGYDIGFTWHGEHLYETLTDTGMPFALMQPTAQLADNRLVSYDFVRQRETVITTDGVGGAITRLAIGGVTFLRSM